MEGETLEEERDVVFDLVWHNNVDGLKKLLEQLSAEEGYAIVNRVDKCGEVSLKPRPNLYPALSASKCWPQP